MPIIGSTSLPVADRARAWDGPGASRRVATFCDGDSRCMEQAFLWRDPDADPTTQAAYKLGFADVIDGRLQLVPRGVAATLGGRGVDASDIPALDKTRIKSKVCGLYQKIRAKFDDWPECPVTASADEWSEPQPVIAAASPDWFQNPGYVEDDERLVLQEADRPEESVSLGAPLSVSDEGQVSGHLALWGRCHVGIGSTCVRPPREESSYRGFLVGEAQPGIPTGPLVLGGGHANLSMSAAAAQSHYDTTSRAVADVTVGADDFGIWTAGAVRASANPSDVDVLRGSALSGDWRPIGGALRLIAVLAVNSPGFRVNRPRAMAASGALQTVGPACEPCGEGLHYETIDDRLARIEKLALELIKQ